MQHWCRRSQTHKQEQLASFEKTLLRQKLINLGDNKVGVDGYQYLWYTFTVNVFFGKISPSVPKCTYMYNFFHLFSPVRYLFVPMYMTFLMYREVPKGTFFSGTSISCTGLDIHYRPCTSRYMKCIICPKLFHKRKLRYYIQQ